MNSLPFEDGMNLDSSAFNIESNGTEQHQRDIGGQLMIFTCILFEDNSYLHYCGKPYIPPFPHSAYIKSTVSRV